MPLYRAVGAVQGYGTEVFESWTDLPAFPVSLFKRASVFCGGDVVREFRTRGTSGGPRGVVRHTLDGCTVANAAVRSVVEELLPGGPVARRVLALFPDPRFAPGSDAALAVANLIGDVGAPRSRFLGAAESGDFAELVEELRSADVAGPPLVIISPALDLLRALDRLSSVGLRFRLPKGSLVVDIGGVPVGAALGPFATLTYACGRVFGLAPWQVVDAYKMVEFATPLIENTARDQVDAPRFKVAPPWVRVRAFEPESLKPLPFGRVGLLSVLDLASIDRPAVLLTDDLGLSLPDGGGGEGRFLVLGRANADQLRASDNVAEAALRAVRELG
jgi:hypothetical protein